MLVLKIIMVINNFLDRNSVRCDAHPPTAVQVEQFLMRISADKKFLWTICTVIFCVFTINIAYTSRFSIAVENVPVTCYNNARTS